MGTPLSYKERVSKKERERIEHEKQLSIAVAKGLKIKIIGEGPKYHQPRHKDVKALLREIETLKRENRRLAARIEGRPLGFYDSREWRELRWKVLRKSDMRCQACGRGRNDGTILHVDHIKPRSKFPELELVESNLQVLCEDCNLGKSNT